MELTGQVKSYDKELYSEEPFVRSMYEDLERRIEEFEDEAISAKQKVQVNDFLAVTIVMAVITAAAFFV